MNKYWVIFQCGKCTYLLKETTSGIMECQKKHFTNFTAAVFDYLLNIYVVKRKHTHNASLWVPLASVAERGRQGGGAALIVQSGASVIDGWVDGDCPHARGITIAVAVVIATAIPWCPHVDAAFSSAPLKTASLGWSEVKICHSSAYYSWDLHACMGEMRTGNLGTSPDCKNAACSSLVITYMSNSKWSKNESESHSYRIQ